MGSWLETCFLSGLPIKEGQPVVCFIILSTGYKGDSIYHVDDFFSPLSFALRGTYNEYGDMSVIHKNEASDLTFQFFEKLQSEGQLNIRHTFDKSLPKEVKSLKDITYLVNRECLSLKKLRYDPPEKHLALVYAHEPLYGSVLDEILKRETLDEGCSLKNRLLKDIKRFKKASTKDSLFQKDIGFLKSSKKDIRFIEFIQKNIDSVINTLVELAAFEESLYLLRKNWSVPLGKGCQTQEYFLPSLISQFVSKTISTVIDVHNKEGDKDIDPLREIIF